MTSIRYTFLLLLLCLFAGTQSLQAQCSAGAVATNVLCAGQNTGSIDLSPSNGTAPYTYLWSDNQTTEDLTDLVAGTYTCTVTDALFCTSTASVAITEPSPLNVSFSGNSILTCMNNNIPVTANVSGGVAPYHYNWSNGATTSTLVLFLPGTYGVTVTDANACTAQANVNVVSEINTPVACVFPAQTLTCAVTTLQVDASCSSLGPTFIYNWFTANGHIVSGTNSITATVDAPGSYSLMVTDVTNGCTSITTVAVPQDITLPFANAGADQDISCSGGVVTLMGGGPIGNQFTYLWSGPGIGANNETLVNPVVSIPGSYVLLITNTANGCTSSDIVNVTQLGTGLCSTIEGFVLLDTLENCLHDAGEPPLSGWIVQASGSLGDYYGVTDANGHYQIAVEAGYTYTLTAVVPSVYWSACPAIPDVVVTNPYETLLAADLMIQKEVGCSLLTVDLSSGNLRRCFDNNLFNVMYCNIGTESVEDAYIIVTLDPFLSIQNSSQPYTDLGNGMIRFEIGQLAEGNCGSFNFYALLSCSASLGQTHCTEAHIYPDTACIPPNPLWSGASLKVTSICEADSVRFRIENDGTGNMPNALNYIVIEDQVMLMSAPVQLDAGEFTTVSVPANGSTWRIEVEQVPYHPGHSSPSISLEACTIGSNFSTGFVTQFSTDDEDEFVDIDCKENTGSYDPNDKQGFPKGYGAQHYIRPGTPLEYQIQFQNTGNDTAFTVRIVDTLATWLDPATFRAGSSSHPYTWDLSGNGVLTFEFQNILLPDSSVNEAASHGFVKFTIKHRNDASLETVIENTAQIYFDFNDAIVTNTTSHRLGENFVTVGLWQPFRPEYAVSVSPNPFVETAILEVKGLRQNGPLHLQVFDLQGKLQMEMESANGQFQIRKGNLPTGTYLFRIDQAGKTIGSGKLLIQY